MKLATHDLNLSPIAMINQTIMY